MVVGNHSFVELIAGAHGVGRKANGEVWTWGDNSFGQLGDNTVESKSSPVIVVGSHVAATVDELLIPSIVWGHQTSVDEDRKRRFTEWRGNLLISLTDDTEKSTVDFEEKIETDMIYTGAIKVSLTKDKY
jgi:alpha-tubulin suppressor-like RCC1 family protein